VTNLYIGLPILLYTAWQIIRYIDIINIFTFSSITVTHFYTFTSFSHLYGGNIAEYTYNAR